jgi:hypothetical protein
VCDLGCKRRVKQRRKHEDGFAHQTGKPGLDDSRHEQATFSLALSPARLWNELE